jgi:hypothetical protein
MARPILRRLAEQLMSLDKRVVLLDRKIARRAKEDAEAKQLAMIPGIGPIKGDSARPVSLEGVTQYPLTFDRPICVTDPSPPDPPRETAPAESRR